jgi:hypothetical protein
LIEIGLLVLEKKIDFLKIFFSGINQPTSGDHDLYRLESTMLGRFYVNLSFFGSLVLEKKIFTRPHHILAFLYARL